MSATDMSATTEAIEIIEALQKAKIPKQTATKLVDYVETQKDKSIDRIWIALLAGFSITIALIVTIPFYLHSNTKVDLQAIENRIEKRFDKLEKTIESLNKQKL